MEIEEIKIKFKCNCLDEIQEETNNYYCEGEPIALTCKKCGETEYF